MEGLYRFAGYSDYKAAFDAEVQRTELGFVRIGYMLRVAQDTDILQESGYRSMEEFAWEEYRIDKSQASRFININRRFSIDGYSDQLCGQYQGYGVAKLGEMLSLPDEVIEVLPEKLTRAEIQEVKREIKEEQKVTDLEVMMEEPASQGGSLLETWMEAYFREHPEGFLDIQGLYGPKDGIETAMGILAPSGQAALMARIPGTGKLMLAIRGKDMPLELLNIRTNSKETYSWEGCIQALKHTGPETGDPIQAYESIYNIPYPEKKAEVAPVQPGHTTQKAAPEPKKPVDGTEAKRKRQAAPEPDRPGPEEKKDVEPQEPEGDTGDSPMPRPEPEQMEIGNYPDVMPEEHITCHDGTEVITPKESIRDEGARLAEEIMLWMKTGTMDYIQETGRQITRLNAIIRELMGHEEHH